jgi:hypothetical protein
MTGASVKATVQPPKEELIANTQRKSNPFLADTDWVASPGSAKNQKADPVPALRKPMLPPRNGTLESPMASESLQAVELGRVPPAVPRKPLALSSQANGGTITPSGQQTSWQGSTGSGVAAGVDSTDLLGDSASEQIEWKPLLQ